MNPILYTLNPKIKGPDNPTCETMFVRNAGLRDEMYEEMYDGGCMRGVVGDEM